MRSRVTAMFGFVVVAACGGDRPTGPGAQSPAQSRIPARVSLSGGGEVVLSGQMVTIDAAAKDSTGEGVPGVVLTFSTGGNSVVEPAARVTDARGVASINWILGAGDGRLTVHYPGLDSASITAHGLDSTRAAFYILRSVAPTYPVSLTGSIFLEDGWFLTSIGCGVAPCGETGWGNYVINDSAIVLEYQNPFLQYWNEFADNTEFGMIRGDTLELKQSDSMWQPYLFTLRFVFNGGMRL